MCGSPWAWGKCEGGQLITWIGAVLRVGRQQIAVEVTRDRLGALETDARAKLISWPGSCHNSGPFSPP
eukprot:1480479-Lingulodinium_polyedra.AAC.1